MLLANSSQNKLVDLDNEILKTFVQYKSRKKAYKFVEDDQISSKDEAAKNHNDSLKGFYDPISETLLGNFDKLYYYLHEDHEINNRHLHPQNVWFDHQILYNYKLLSGVLYIKPEDEDEVKTIFSSTSNEQLGYKTTSTLRPHKFSIVTRLKINSLQLYGNGGSMVSLVRKKIYQLCEDHTFDSINNYRQYHNCMVVEAFGFNELIVITRWNCHTCAHNFVNELKVLKLEDLSSDELAKDLSKCKNNSYVTHQCKIKEYEDDEIKIEEVFANVFDRSSSMLSLNNRQTINEINDHCQNHNTGNDQLSAQIMTTWSVKNANNDALSKNYPNHDLLGLYGWQDIGFLDYIDKKPNVKAVIEDIDQYANVVDHTYSLVYSKINDHTIPPKDPDPEDLRKIQQIEKARYDFFKTFQFDTSTLREAVDMMQEIGISHVVIQRTIYAITNFNKCITESENFCFFVELRRYIQTHILNTIKRWHKVIEDPKYITADDQDTKWPSKEAQESKELIYRIDTIESDLITTLKGFETTFTNRFIHSKDLAEISDVNYSYRGGIQQYLIIFEYLNDLISNVLLGDENYSSTLYVSAYTQTESYHNYVRLNIFQIYEPALYISILNHEVSIHALSRIISYIFSSSKTNIITNEHDMLKGRKVKDVLTLISKLGYELDSKEYRALCDQHNINIDKKSDGRNFYAAAQQYLLADYLLLRLQYCDDTHLFIYWHIIQHIQSSGRANWIERTMRKKRVMLLFRFLLLIQNLKSGDSTDTINYLKTLTSDLGWEDALQDANYLYKKYVEDDNFDFLEMVKSTQELADILSPDYLDDQIIEELKTKYPDPKIDTNTWHIARNEYYGPDIKDEEEQSKFVTHQSLKSYISISYSYLKYYHKSFPNILPYRYESVTTAPTSIKECTSRKNTICVDTQGGLSVLGTKNRLNVIQMKIKFLQTMWQLAHLHQRVKLMELHKDAIKEEMKN